MPGVDVVAHEYVLVVLSLNSMLAPPDVPIVYPIVTYCLPVAGGFVLTQIKKNRGIIELPNGEIGALMTYGKGSHALKNNGKASPPAGSKFLEGFQFRYIYFIDKNSRKNLTCEEIPFSKVNELGAGMYLGEKKVGFKIRCK